MTQRNHISTCILALATSLLILAHAIPCQAQSRKKMAEQEPDTVPLFRGLSVSADLVGPGMMLMSDYGQMEAHLRINLKDKYFPVFEMGWGKADANEVSTKISYKTSAPYFRAGMDWNLLKKKHDPYRLYAGFRYAFTAYKFDVSSAPITDPVWGGQAEWEAKGVSCNYHWLEGVFGVDAKIWGPVRLGWSIRYRRRLFSNDGNIGNTWYVPGFGKQGGSTLGATFNVTLEI